MSFSKPYQSIPIPLRPSVRCMHSEKDSSPVKACLFLRNRPAGGHKNRKEKKRKKDDRVLGIPIPVPLSHPNFATQPHIEMKNGKFNQVNTNSASSCSLNHSRAASAARVNLFPVSNSWSLVVVAAFPSSPSSSSIASSPSSGCRHPKSLQRL